MSKNNIIKIYRNKHLFLNLILPATLLLFLLILFIRLPIPSGFQWLINGSILILLLGIAILIYTFFTFSLLFRIDNKAIEINSFFKRKKIEKDLIHSFKVSRPYWGKVLDYKKLTIEYTNGNHEHYYMPDFNAQDLAQQWSNS